MAYIVVADISEEIDRRELSGPMVIGRSPECDLPIRDILLSRRHCILEHIGDAWVIADLSSKNGTRINGELITRHILHDSDVVRLGRTRICFREGPFVPAPPNTRRPNARPANPTEALAGTLAGFRMNEEAENELDLQVLATFPRPKPRPAEPRAFQNERVYTMLDDIASSEWDMMLTAPSRRVRTAELPCPKVAAAGPSAHQPVPRQMNQSAKKSSRRFDRGGVFAILSIGAAALLTATSIWVISWSW